MALPSPTTRVSSTTSSRTGTSAASTRTSWTSPSIEQSLTRPVNDYGPNGGQQANIATTNGATQVGTTVTIQTTGSHGLSVGQDVEVAGVAEFAYNGEVVVTSIPAANRFTYELGVSGLARFRPGRRLHRQPGRRRGLG